MVCKDLGKDGAGCGRLEEEFSLEQRMGWRGCRDPVQQWQTGLHSGESQGPTDAAWSAFLSDCGALAKYCQQNRGKNELSNGRSCASWWK